MCRIGPYNSIILFQAAIEQPDDSVCETGGKERGRPVLTRNGRHRALRVRLNVLCSRRQNHTHVLR